MTTANKLTLARVALIPVFLVILYLDFPYARCAAFGVFVVACLTDFVDGYIARHYNQVTNFGKFMDPLADKVLVMAAMCYLVEIGQMPGWCLAIVLLREVPPNATVVGVPGRIVRLSGEKLDHIHTPDPVMLEIEALKARVEQLEAANSKQMEGE